MGASSYFEGVIKKRREFGYQFEEISRRLNDQHAQLRVRIRGLQNWQNQVLRSCALYMAHNEKAKSKVYGNELLEIHKTLRAMQQAELIIEALRLRVGTAKELGEVNATLKPLTYALMQVKRELHDFVPQVARELDVATETLTSVLSNTAQGNPVGDFTAAFETDAVDEILKEMSSEADRRLSDGLEHIEGAEMKPIVDYVRANGVESIKSIIENGLEATSKYHSNAVMSENGVADSSGLIYVTLTEPSSDPSQRVYEYIKENSGRVDIAKCCKALGLDREAVLSSFETLQRKGKIKLG